MKDRLHDIRLSHTQVGTPSNLSRLISSNVDKVVNYLSQLVGIFPLFHSLYGLKRINIPHPFNIANLRA